MKWRTQFPRTGQIRFGLRCILLMHDCYMRLMDKIMQGLPAKVVRVSPVMTELSCHCFLPSFTMRSFLLLCSLLLLSWSEGRSVPSARTETLQSATLFDLALRVCLLTLRNAILGPRSWPLHCTRIIFNASKSCRLRRHDQERRSAGKSVMIQKGCDQCEQSGDSPSAIAVSCTEVQMQFRQMDIRQPV